MALIIEIPQWGRRPLLGKVEVLCESTNCEVQAYRTGNAYYSAEY